jgi:hypothetical protein
LISVLKYFVKWLHEARNQTRPVSMLTPSLLGSSCRSFGPCGMVRGRFNRTSAAGIQPHVTSVLELAWNSGPKGAVYWKTCLLMASRCRTCIGFDPMGLSKNKVRKRMRPYNSKSRMNACMMAIGSMIHCGSLECLV